MQTSLLIYGADTTRREERANLLAKETSSQFDTIIHSASEESGIGSVRETIARLSRKPFSSQLTTAIFLEAQLLGLEAQNALLKSLEEPTATIQIILTCPNPFAVIPTIASRCQKIDLGKVVSVINQPERKQFEKFFDLNFGTRLSFAESLDLEAWENFWREKLLNNLGSSSVPALITYLRAINKTREFLLKRANQKLAKINLILDVPKID